MKGEKRGEAGSSTVSASSFCWKRVSFLSKTRRISRRRQKFRVRVAFQLSTDGFLVFTFVALLFSEFAAWVNCILIPRLRSGHVVLFALF